MMTPSLLVLLTLVERAEAEVFAPVAHSRTIAEGQRTVTVYWKRNSLCVDEATERRAHRRGRGLARRVAPAAVTLTDAPAAP